MGGGQVGSGVTIKVVGGQEHNKGDCGEGRCCEGLELQCILHILIVITYFFKVMVLECKNATNMVYSCCPVMIHSTKITSRQC